jgi:hypothetical protein
MSFVLTGINVAETTHLVNALPPQDISGGATSDVWSMAMHGHASILIQVGASAAAFTKILLNACDDTSGTNPVAIAYRYYDQETSSLDGVSLKKAATAAGVTPSANDNIMYVIEVDNRELPDGKTCLQVEFTNGANSVLASVLVVLSSARVLGVNAPSVL